MAYKHYSSITEKQADEISKAYFKWVKSGKSRAKPIMSRATWEALTPDLRFMVLMIVHNISVTGLEIGAWLEFKAHTRLNMFDAMTILEKYLFNVMRDLEKHAPSLSLDDTPTHGMTKQ